MRFYTSAGNSAENGNAVCACGPPINLGLTRESEATTLGVEELQWKVFGKQELTETSSSWGQDLILSVECLPVFPDAALELCFVSGKEENSRDALTCRRAGYSKTLSASLSQNDSIL